MAKDEFEEIIDDEEYDNFDYENEDELSEEFFEDKLTKDKEGRAKFKNVNHRERALANGVNSDGEVTAFVNYALEYFDYKCALSGEKFVIFDKPVKREKNNKITTNLSAEHIVALVTGGNDIIPNIVPSVLQYNIQKNGYYILDWWPKARDIHGNPIYTTEKLLKMTNFMLKSLQIRKELGIKPSKRKYRERLLEPNEIDEYLEQDGIAEKLVSDTITATQDDVDGKKILTQIPEKEGDIPSLVKQKEKDAKITESMFLLDSIEKLEKENIPQEIIQKLKQMYTEIEGEIPFEIEVRQHILAVIEENGLNDNKYTVANNILINSGVLKDLKDKSIRNSADIRKFIQEDFVVKMEEFLKTPFAKTLEIARVLYENGVDLSPSKLQLGRRVNYDDGTFSIISLKLSEMSQQGVDFQKIIEENGLNPDFPFGRNIKSIRSFCYGSKTDRKLTDEERREVEMLGIIKDERAEALEIFEILFDKGIDFSNFNFSKRIAGGKRHYTLLSEIDQKGINIKAIIEEYNLNPDYEIGKKIGYFSGLYNREKEKLTEEEIRKLEKLGIVTSNKDKRHPYLILVESTLPNWLEKNELPQKHKRPKNKKEEIENNLACKIANLKKFVNERKKKEKLTEEEIMIIEKAEELGIKDENKHRYIILLEEVKAWQSSKNTTQIPQSKQEERKKIKKSDEYYLAQRIGNMKDTILFKYQYYTYEEFLKLPDDIQEIIKTSAEMGIGNEIHIIKMIRERMGLTNSEKLIKEEQTYYINMLKIKEWMEKQPIKTKPPRSQQKDKEGNKTIPEEEAKMGGALNSIKQYLIKPYEKLKTEEERIEYKRIHPEYEDVKAWIDELDRNNPNSWDIKFELLKGLLEADGEYFGLTAEKVKKVQKQFEEKGYILQSLKLKKEGKDEPIGSWLNTQRQMLNKYRGRTKEEIEDDEGINKEEKRRVIELLKLGVRATKKVTSQSLGQAGFGTPVEKCDEAQSDLARRVEVIENAKGVTQDE